MLGEINDENIDDIDTCLVEQDGEYTVGISIQVNAPCELCFTLKEIESIYRELLEENSYRAVGE